MHISGGKHKNKRLVFPPVSGIRPVQSVVRSTLFNWIGNNLNNKNCLDLFAGSGVLAWEVLSRGAAAVTLVEQNPTACRNLRRQRDILGYDKKKVGYYGQTVSILQRDVLSWLQKLDIKNTLSIYDLIFVDPPYAGKYFQKSSLLIMQKGLISQGGIIFFETNKKEFLNLPALFDQYALLQSAGKTKKNISYSLLKSSKRGATYFGIIG